MIPTTKTLKRQMKLWGAKSGIALVLALMGAAVYLAFSIHFANTQRSTIDEGLYLYKGYLLAKDIYHPYQDYGPRMEYSPLSYLTPGYVQLWFGPGLRTGRIFAIIVGGMALLGLWASARRLAGPWWAAMVVWAVALNPAVIRFYSFGLSQGLVTCLLMWMLFLVLGRNRETWQAPLSAVLAGLILLTRQNMAPVLPILLVYIFWQFGRKQGLIATLAGVIIVIVGNVVFLPGILVVWAPWLPATLTPFLNAWRQPEGVTPALNFQHDWITRLYTLLEGLRFHFVSLAGSIVGLVLWPARKAWKSDQQFRSGVFLAVLFFLLLGLHIWAGLGLSGINYGNAYTVNPYLAFFAYIGLLFAIAVFSNFQKHLSASKQIFLSLLVILISAGIGYGSFLSTSPFLLYLRIPRIWSFFKTGKILPGVPIWDYLANKYSLPYNTSRWLIPLLSGLLCGCLVLLISFAIRSFLNRKRLLQFYSFGAIVAVVFILAGILFSPTVALGGGFTQWECNMNVIKGYEQTGQFLASALSPGDLVYWGGGNAVSILLYVPNIKIFPQQLDDQWNFYHGGDDNTLARLGLWNDELAKLWRDKADVIIIKQVDFPIWQSYLDKSEFVELQSPKTPLDCEPDTFLRVFIRKGNIHSQLSGPELALQVGEQYPGWQRPFSVALRALPNVIPEKAGVRVMYPRMVLLNCPSGRIPQE